MRYLRLLLLFARAEAQQELAYRTNFVASLLEALLRVATGVAGIAVIFSHVEQVRGWEFASTLAVLGVYLSLDALRGLVIEPSFEALAGEGGDIHTGRFDFTLLKPVDAQFLSSVKRWQLFSVLDLGVGLGVAGTAISLMGGIPSPGQVIGFLVALCVGFTLLYAVVLACSSLVFWVPEVYFTWIFDSIFQLARFPVGLYPGWLRLLLTWVIPVGVMTTIPAEALAGRLSVATLIGAGFLAVISVGLASWLFRAGLRRYTSASS
ncbi:MAG TPA: ABC-2 family transporter protein [Chloroflexota bacterium]|nr:ABC-2 family transporter protein [Chloroflexota bacterium]